MNQENPHGTGAGPAGGNRSGGPGGLAAVEPPGPEPARQDTAEAHDTQAALSGPAALSEDDRRHIADITRRQRRQAFVTRGVQLLLVVGALALWEGGARTGVINTFFLGSPTILWELLQNRFASSILPGAGITLGETLAGFVLGNIIGISVGLALWYSRFLARVLDPFILAFGATPVLALAPLIIIWFGTGYSSKVALATLSCVVVALLQAYKGATSVDEDLISLMRSFGATKHAIFRKIVMPSSYSWVVAALKLNIGFALIGAVIGEFISSQAGLGHIILVAGANYNIPLVLLGIICLSVLALIMNLAVGRIESYLLRWQDD
ncbi:MAG TPA: ABC transporter permease [Egibacteraceae bacterium]|nr:ABC transporter permease [Egibacteraceae bacterium]